MNKLFAGMIVLALASFASAAPKAPKTSGEPAAEKQMGQKRNRSKDHADTGGNHKAKKEPKTQTGTTAPSNPTVK